MEIRLKDVSLEYDNDSKRIGGYINVVERASEVMYSHRDSKWFKETMKSGVFTRALQKNQSVPLLLEHDWDKQVAHTNDGTLELREDSIGLRFDAMVSEDTYKEIESRGITACSFGFKINEQECEPINPKLEKRYVTNIDLFEVSLVSNPAYVGSLVEKRALEDALKLEENENSEQELRKKSEENSEDSEKEKKEESKEDKTDEEKTDSDKEVKEESEDRSEEESDEQKEEKRDAESNIIVDTMDSETKGELKDVIQDTIERTQTDAQLYSQIAQDIDIEKQEVLDHAQDMANDLEHQSLHYTFLAQSKWLEVAKLKQLNMKL